MKSGDLKRGSTGEEWVASPTSRNAWEIWAHHLMMMRPQLFSQALEAEEAPDLA